MIGCIILYPIYESISNLEKPPKILEPSSRSYQSPTRQRQADETRRRIAAAARELLVEHGYNGMTIDAVAGRAEVSAQTVYAIFRSKRGILTELLDEARRGPQFVEAVQQTIEAGDPETRLKSVARITRTVYTSENEVMDLLRGAGVVAPELAALEQERECMRYEGQKHNIAFIIESGRLKAGLDEAMARDIQWTFTSRDIYRMLVKDRGWPADQYEAWVAEMLIASLLS